MIGGKIACLSMEVSRCLLLHHAFQCIASITGSDAGKLIDPSFLTSGNVSVQWSTKVFWMLPMNYALDNIWYLASRTLPLFKVLCVPSAMLGHQKHVVNTMCVVIGTPNE
jgi:hypothetical protein